MEKELNEMIELIQKPVVNYIIGLMGKAGVKVSQEEAENILSNIGTHMLKKKLSAKNNLPDELP